MKTTLNDIKKLGLDEMYYDYFGMRIDECTYSVGDIANNSHQLFQDPEFDDDGELIYEKGEGIYADYYDAGELDGTCCIRFDPEDDNSILNAINAIDSYYGNNLHILAGNSSSAGNDLGEIIIRNAVVVGVFED